MASVKLFYIVAAHLSGKSRNLCVNSSLHRAKKDANTI